MPTQKYIYRCILGENDDSEKIGSAFSQHGAILMGSAFKPSFWWKIQNKLAVTCFPHYPLLKCMHHHMQQCSNDNEDKDKENNTTRQ